MSSYKGKNDRLLLMVGGVLCAPRTRGKSFEGETVRKAYVRSNERSLTDLVGVWIKGYAQFQSS